MLSICITCQNRSKIQTKNYILEPLPQCLKAINKLSGDIEVVISDWNSTDTPIEEVTQQYLTKIPYKIVKMENDKFEIYEGLNKSFEESQGGNILFMDADLIVQDKYIKKNIKNLKNGNVIFPIVFAFIGMGLKKGIWCTKDYRTLMIQRDMYEKVKPWKNTDSKGTQMHRFCKINFGSNKIIREKDRGFLHHWHPNTKKNIWTRRKRS